MDLRAAWASPEARALAGRWILAVTVVTSVVALGSLHTPVLVLTAMLAALGTGLLWFDAEPLAPRSAATILVAVAVLLVGASSLQVVPMPREILAALAPENADVWARALTPFREDGPRSVTLSLDPIATRVQILRGITYLTVFVGALRVARRQDGVVFLERVLAASAVLVASAALLHPAVGADKVFGVYEPGEPLGYEPHHISPLLDTNHLAAYCNVGAVVAFASILQRRSALPRPLALAVVLLLGATTVWTRSRGGTATLVLGAIVASVLAFGARRTKLVRLAAPLALVVVGASGALVVALAAFDEFRAKIAYNDLSKIDLVKNAFALVRAHPLFGVGRGAFESTFPRVRVGTNYWVFTHPENVVAQWMTEWGTPIALIGLGAIAWALRPKTALARSRAPAGPWGALVAVGLHNLCDFNAEVPGVVIALAVCAATVTGGTGGGVTTSDRWSVFAGWTRRPTALASALAFATVVASAVALPFTGRELYNEQRTFRDVGLDRSLSKEAFRARAREAMLRHPAEPYFPFVGAVRAVAYRQESVLPWAARALERSPIYGRVHLLLARSLFATNASQARLEYRTACLQDDRLCAVQEAIPLVRSYEDAIELVPDGAVGLSVLAHLTETLGARLPSTVVRLDREIVARDPGALGPVERAAARALGDVNGEEEWCGAGAASEAASRRSCIGEGLAAVMRLRAYAPDKCEGHALGAELRVAAGEIDAGYAELDRSLEQVEKRSECARRLVALAVRIGNPLRIDAALDRLAKLGCETGAECVTNLTFAAAVEEKRGAHRRALTLTKKAWERAPEREELLVDLAMRAEAEGVWGEALDAYGRLGERHPDDPRWKDGVARAKAAATRGMFERR